MYKSPIEIIHNQMIAKFEKDIYGEICKATAECGYQVNIDKEELIKALSYDRGQYEKGYADGFEEARKIYEKALNKACEQLEYKDNCLGMSTDQWKEWCMKDE